MCELSGIFLVKGTVLLLDKVVLYLGTTLELVLVLGWGNCFEVLEGFILETVRDGGENGRSNVLPHSHLCSDSFEPAMRHRT